MMVSIGQIYIKPGVLFPFSHKMQRWLGDQLSSLIEESVEFKKKFGNGYRLMIRVSADTGIEDNLIKGPTVFKRDRDVEFTVFLPFDVIARAPDGCRVAMEFLMAGIHSILEKAGLKPGQLDEKRTFLVERVCADPIMLSKPWR